jgi:multiple sugar transport system substrate-binding protein
MIQVLAFYKKLSRFTPYRNINWLLSRKEYLSGRTAMTMWSPFILDELSGLRNDLPVIPDIIMGEKGYLANNTGFVTVIKGPRGAAQYSYINCLSIMKDADSVSAKRWAEFLLSDGYLRWLDMAPEGKWPQRKGTRLQPDYFIKGWMDLSLGATVPAKISERYGMGIIKLITNMPDTDIHNWSNTQKEKTIVNSLHETKIVSKILNRFINSELSAEQTARMMNEKIKAIEQQ